MKKIIYLIMFLSYTIRCATVPFYSPRSQSLNTARHLVSAGWNTQINLCNIKDWNGNFAITPEYTQSFKPYRICECLFGCFAQYCDPSKICGSSCCRFSSCFTCTSACHVPPCTSCDMGCCEPCFDSNCCFLRITGSQASNRSVCDLLADNFGLPTDYKSFVGFKPEISNFLVDFSFNLGIDEWVQGLYITFHAPIVNTRWDLNMGECIECDGIDDHWPGYFSSNLAGTVPNLYGIKRFNLVSSFTEFICGAGTIESNDIRFNPLGYAKMDCRAHKKASLADLRMALGWNFICKDNYHFGLSVQAAAPTGNRPEAYYFFEPIVGNGKHWEIGGGLSGHWDFWKGEETCGSFYIDANITHLFRTKQNRTFDLYGKPLSRYMLAAEFGSPVTGLTAGPTAETATSPSKQFKGIYTPVANITTFAVDVEVSLQADISLMLQLSYSNVSLDIGYNLWARACEKIYARWDCPCQFEENRWALKGDSFMYGFNQDLDGSITSTAVALSATQSKATICCGSNNWPNGFDGLAWPQNPGINNRQLAWNSDGDPLIIYDVTNSTTHQIYTSLDPVFIEFCDININQSGTKGLSHKLFFHLDYSWKEQKSWIPYFGIGGEVEFGHTNNSCNNDYYSCCMTCTTVCGCTPAKSCYEGCRCCTYCSLSQWGIWLKGGVGFH